MIKWYLYQHVCSEKKYDGVEFLIIFILIVYHINIMKFCNNSTYITNLNNYTNLHVHT